MVREDGEARIVPPSAPLPQDDPASLSWTLFVTRRDSRYAVWNGYILTPTDYALKYGATEVRYLDELPLFLQNLTAQDPSGFTFFTLSFMLFGGGLFICSLRLAAGGEQDPCEQHREQGCLGARELVLRSRDRRRERAHQHRNDEAGSHRQPRWHLSSSLLHVSVTPLVTSA